jgi:hypothetical protein
MDLSEANEKWFGTGEDVLAGESVAPAGDVDMDGVAEVLIGVPCFDWFDMGRAGSCCPGAAYLVSVGDP